MRLGTFAAPNQIYGSRLLSMHDETECGTSEAPAETPIGLRGKEGTRLKILVIGGTGLTGPYIVRELIDTGHTVTVFHRGESEVEMSTHVQHLHGDRARIDAYADELRRLEPDVVVDMAAMAYEDTIAVMRTFRGVAKRIIGVSSADVYRAYDVLLGHDTGPLQPLPLTEDATLRSHLFPEGPDREKILVERALLSDPDLPGTVLRYPMVYGQNDGGRIVDELKRMDDRRPYIMLDQRQATWRWSRGYAEDVAHATVLAVVSDCAAGQTYNVGEPDALSMQNWIEAVGRAANWVGNVLRFPRAVLPAHLQSDLNWDQHWVLDTSRIRVELGYTEQVPRGEALRRTVEWWREAGPESIRPPFAVDASADTYAAEDAALARFRGGV